MGGIERTGHGNRSERDRNAEINYTSVTEAFDTKIAIAMVLGIVLAAPVWLYQVWAFFVPALMRKERRYALGFLSAAVPLFFAGVALGWTILPNIVILLTEFCPRAVLHVAHRTGIPGLRFEIGHRDWSGLCSAGFSGAA